MTHFGHGNIIKYCNRPFLTELDRRALEANGGKWHVGEWKGEGSTPWRITRDAVDMMNDHITDNINRVVGPSDTLWILGDFAFAPRDRYRHRCEFYRNRIKCQNINIVWGNHDQPNQIGHLFNESYDLRTIYVGKIGIVLCHFALAIWNKSHRSAIHLYGHSHGNAEKTLEGLWPLRRAMDVGVDNAAKILGEYRPFSLDEILEIMKDRPGQPIDMHGQRVVRGLSEEELSG